MKLKHGRLDCLFCGKLMNSIKARKTHELIHNDHSKMCWVCGLVVKDELILHQHIQKHSEKTHPCNICNRLFLSPLVLKRHTKSHFHVEERKHICHICPQMFTRRRHLEKHILTHSTNQLFLCHICGRCFTSKEQFMKHGKRCDTLFGNYPSVGKELTVGNKIKTINQVPNTEAKSNEEDVEERLSLECDINNIKTINKVPNTEVKSNEEKVEERTLPKCDNNTLHTTKQRKDEICLECNICGRNFKKTFNALRHRKYHFCKGDPEIVQKLLNEPEEYNCDMCGHLSYSKLAAQAHRAKKHSGEVKPFSCEFCHKKFRTRPQILVHERMHSGERPYPCASCNKRFQTKTHLRHHEHIHSKEKPYLCPLCGSAFRSSSGLMEHTFRHEIDEAQSERPFQCTYCGNRFFTERVLKAHITRNHSVECQQENKNVQDKEGLQCGECGKVLANLVALKKHDKRMHRHMLVEVRPTDQIKIKNKSMKTLRIENLEYGLYSEDSGTKVSEEYVDNKNLEMSDIK